MRLLKVGLFMVMALVVGVGAVSADDVPVIDDGRVNNWELAAPAAIYCTFEQLNPDNLDESTFTGIEVLGINGENNGTLLFDVDAEDIAASVDADTLLASASGYDLYQLESGSFYLAGPADDEGKVYSFTWERGDQGC